MFIGRTDVEAETLQYFGHLMRRADSFEKTLMLGKIGGRRRRGQQKMRWLDGITNLMEMIQWKIPRNPRTALSNMVTTRHTSFLST